VQNSRLELEERKHRLPLEKIQEMALERPRPRDLVPALKGSEIKIIAEVKKASPSKGIICQDFYPVEIAREYAANNAAAISILTENKFFQGSLKTLSDINSVLGETRPPLLRKDFIFDPYQIYESRAFGADALLLIVAILDFDILKELLELSHRLHMRCLVESHNENELQAALRSGAEIIGINNRDLNTFKVDLSTTGRLRHLIPQEKIVVSESGIRTHQDIQKLREWNINAALIGETLVTSNNISLKMKELL